jgi:hypothetical protein
VGVASRGEGGGGWIRCDSRRRRREKGGVGANMKLIRVEDCSLNIKSIQILVIEYPYLFIL